jgi:hypothetical protein
MKSLRVKIPDVQTSKSAFHFISIAKCSEIKLGYESDSSLTSILIHTFEGEKYTLLKTMLSFEYELFKYRYLKFIDSDELFFNLSDFQID